MDEKILKILGLCFQAKAKGIDVFFNYSSHVQVIRIYTCEKGWYTNYNYDNHFDFYLDAGDTGKKADEVIEHFEMLIEERSKDGN